MIESLKNKSNSIALIGSSNDPRKYGNKILLDLTKKGYTVYPVNKKEKEIEGLKAYKNIEMLEEIPSIINFVIPPDEGLVCLLYTSPSPRDTIRSRMPSSA